MKIRMTNWCAPWSQTIEVQNDMLCFTFCWQFDKTKAAKTSWITVATVCTKGSCFDGGNDNAFKRSINAQKCLTNHLRSKHAQNSHPHPFQMPWIWQTNKKINNAICKFGNHQNKWWRTKSPQKGQVVRELWGVKSCEVPAEPVSWNDFKQLLNHPNADVMTKRHVDISHKLVQLDKTHLAVTLQTHSLGWRMNQLATTINACCIAISISATLWVWHFTCQALSQLALNTSMKMQQQADPMHLSWCLKHVQPNCIQLSINCLNYSREVSVRLFALSQGRRRWHSDCLQQLQFDFWTKQQQTWLPLMKDCKSLHTKGWAVITVKEDHVGFQKASVCLQNWNKTRNKLKNHTHFSNSKGHTQRHNNWKMLQWKNDCNSQCGHFVSSSYIHINLTDLVSRVSFKCVFLFSFLMFWIGDSSFDDVLIFFFWILWQWQKHEVSTSALCFQTCCQITLMGIFSFEDHCVHTKTSAVVQKWKSLHSSTTVFSPHSTSVLHTCLLYTSDAADE